MKKLLLTLIVGLSFVGFGVSTISASIIKDGIVLASNDKCGGSKCGTSDKCGGEKAKKCEDGKCASGKCGGDKAKKCEEGKCGGDKGAKCAGQGKCGESDKPKKRAITGSCGEGKCG